MSVKYPSGSRVTISKDSNDHQSLLVFKGDGGACGVLAIRDDVDADAALELVESIEAEVASHVPGLRLDRKPIAVRDLGAAHE